MEANATQGCQENVEEKRSQPKRSDCDDKVPASSGKFRQVPASFASSDRFWQAPAGSASSGKFQQVPASSGKFWQVLQAPTMMIIYSIEESGCGFEESGSIKDPA